MNERDVTPSEHVDFFETPIRRLQSTYACILAVACCSCSRGWHLMASQRLESRLSP